MEQSTLPYARLARALVDARLAAGFATQGDLARALGIAQQSVSRWEKGSHRPKREQISAIAQLLSLKAADLSFLAAYETPSAPTFVKPLPLEKLDPEAFEQFTADLVTALMPDTRVRRLGKTGHDQAGADIIATASDGRRIALQCKRAEQFGPAQVDMAVVAFEIDADEKIIVLSRVASPQASARVEAHVGFDIWDKDDLTRSFRMLSPAQQDRIVDTYFRGQNLDLLGRLPIGAWLDGADFFRPFVQPGALFTHDWKLSGRRNELERLDGLMADPAQRLVMLSAPGGMGKSRLLMEVTNNRGQADPATKIWFLSSASEVSRKDLGRLGAGPKLIVIDDAHDRQTLGVVFEYVADPQNQARLVIATRPYARERLRREASIFGLTPAEVELGYLNTDALVTITQDMLASENEPAVDAEQIVAIAGGSPLIASMAVRILSRAPMVPLKVRNQQGLRDYVLKKFAEVVAGHLGGAAPETNLKVLEILALVQPFHPNDSQLMALIEAVHQIPPIESERILKAIVDGGVALRRGAQHRLMPDVLGDYLIDESCVVGDRLSAFAQRVLDAASPRLLGSIIINLGRLDWRRTDGDTSHSRLLDEVWQSLRSISEDYDERLDAVRAVAIFQPRQALQLVHHLVRRGVGDQVTPEILRNIALAEGYLHEAVSLLWEMARRDEREPGPHPSHPLRMLTSIADFETGKPIEINESLLEFALSEADRPDVWHGPHTPIDLLAPFLATEGVRNRSYGRGITLSPFEVRHDAVAGLRARVIDKLLELMRRPEPRVARLAASAFDSVLRGPIGLLNSKPSDDVVAAYATEIGETLQRLEATVREGVEDTTALALAGTIRWHADGRRESADRARAVIAAMPQSLAFQTCTALAEPYNNIFTDRGGGDWRNDSRRWLEGVAEELRTTFPQPTDRLGFVELQIRRLETAGFALSSLQLLLQTLCAQDIAFARALVDAGETRPGGALDPFLSLAAQEVRAAVPGEARDIASRWLAVHHPSLRRSAPFIFADRFERIETDDIDMIRAMLVDDDPFVILGALRVAWLWRPTDQALLIDLLFTTRLEDPQVLEQIAYAIGGREADIAEQLTETQVQTFLDAIEPIPKLEGHWINETIAAFSRLHPRRTAEFFRRRVMRSMQSPFDFRPANYGPYARARLNFIDTPEWPAILRDTWSWLQEHWGRGFEFRYGAVKMFDAMFVMGDDSLVEFFDVLIAGANEADLDLMSSLLREAHHTFVFRHAAFVIRLLDRAAAFDQELAEEVAMRLYGSATSGMYSGMPGEPMPRDLEARDSAMSVLAKLSPLSPAWELYDWILKHAEQNIERSRQEGEMMDEL